MPADLRAALFENFSFCLPDAEMCLGYPVPGRDDKTQVGRRAYNIVWYRPTDPEVALVDLCTDATGRRHAGGPVRDAGVQRSLILARTNRTM